MAELESAIEKSLIDKLCHDKSQWTYRADIKTEEQLWNNFKYILEQNNKAKLNDVPLSESEFAKIKNDISHASFYEAGKWLVGENGKVYVHIQRGNEMLHLLVMNNEHICGGTSVYEVINQYQAFATGEDEDIRNRRFDVTLLINGIPVIHIELKNKNHSYMDGYRQIKKYISEGKFHGIFSNIQMFVVSNVVDTKYFSAARDTELNKKFISGWLDKKNNPVCNYIEFADSVLHIPQAHKMVAQYTVLDNEVRRLLLLRPYQIHAIEAMRAASQEGKSGYIWHTTGSGKTMTSYKATRNLLMDIPAIEKTIFLIDRKDLDTQTKMAFQSYADNDTIDVDDTDNVNALINRLTDGNRQMIVTTIQKLQIMIKRRLKEGDRAYQKIRNLRIAFVVDECHRAVTPGTKRKIEEFFSRSLWYGFTGTPITDENPYEKKGDLPQTTKQLYGECLHSYTIKEAIHDEAVLGFMVENLGPKENVEDSAVFESETHMRQVLDIILNRSASKFGLQKGKGRTFEGILTVKSIPIAQKYYKLLKRIKEGNDELKISDKIHQALPDFPKFAITYSLSENKEGSEVNQIEMQESLKDYEFSEEEYEDYAAMYRNVVEEFQSERDPSTSDGPVVNDYDLIAYHKIKIDFEYLVELLQGFVDSLHPETNNQKQSDFQDKIKEIREMVNEFSQSNQKMGNLLSIIVEEIENDSRKYFRQDISAIINRRRYEAINKEIFAFAKKWFISPEEVWYHVQHFQNGIIANKTNLKKAAQYSEYKVSTEHPMTKLQFNQSIVKEFKNELMENILPLLR